jgi:type IV secretory pathway VirB10-like protein
MSVKEIRECYKYFKDNNIWSDDENEFIRNFRKWALKNHPDKNPNTEEIFKVINNCRQSIGNHSKFKSIAEAPLEMKIPIVSVPNPTPTPAPTPTPKPTAYRATQSPKRKSKRKSKSPKRKSKRAKSPKRKSKRAKSPKRKSKRAEAVSKKTQVKSKKMI